MIVYAWIDDPDTKCAYESSDGAYLETQVQFSSPFNDD